MDITFSWFASVYASFLIFLTKIFQKKSILILGGVDVAKLPEFKYGIWNNRWKSKIVKYGITHADIVLAVDQSIKQDAIALAEYAGTNIQVLPTGHDASYWQPGPIKKNIVLTVATCPDETRFRIKGIDFLYKVAEALPDTQFVLVGLKVDMMKVFPPPPNLMAHEFKAPHDLLKEYQQAKVYFQPSRREAFGSALCEAMLCDCYPVGTNVGGIPTVIGNTGSIVPYGNVPAAEKEIRKAFSRDRSHEPRQRIIMYFSTEQREKGIKDAITRLSHA